MIEKLLLNLPLAFAGIYQNKLRSLLTALGIIFGVFAVIAMMAIGNGAEKSIMEQLKIVGTNNIVISSIPPSENGEEEGESSDMENKKSFTPGLTEDDAISIANLLSNEENISIEVGEDAEVIFGKSKLNTKLMGVNNDFFVINNLEILEGSYFDESHHIEGTNVCLLGGNIAKKLFLGKSPLGRYVKSKNVVLKVIGVLKNRLISEENYQNLGINNYGNQLFIPYQTFKIRIENKGKVDRNDILTRGRRQVIENYHQLDKMIIKLNEASEVEASGAVLSKLLRRRHYNQVDYEIEIPELLIKQQKDTQETLNFVFAVIAGISLLVGGIGIMNIMLASVMERIKEIGLRRSIGATEQDIVFQFLLEAIAISLIGGFIGIIMGIGGAWLIGQYADIPIEVSGWSILLSFFIASSVGVIFGFMPARKAAKLDPITALRTE